MTKQVINTGTVANDGTGDTIRAAMTKTNSNFQEIYQSLGNGSTLKTIVDGVANELAFYSDPTTLARTGGLSFDRTTKRMRLDGTTAVGGSGAILTLADNSGCTMNFFEYGDSASTAPGLILVKHRGTIANPLPPQVNDVLGSYSVWSTLDGSAETSFSAGRVSWLATAGAPNAGVNTRITLQCRIDGTVRPVLESNADGSLKVFGTYNLPTVNGAAGQVLTTNGAGQTTWAYVDAPIDLTATVTDILPSATNQYDIGSPAKLFDKVLASTVSAKKYSFDAYDTGFEGANLINKGIVSNNGDINVYNQHAMNLGSTLTADGIMVQSSDYKPVRITLETANSSSSVASIDFTRAANGTRVFMVGRQLAGIYSTPTTGIYFSDDSGASWNLVVNPALPSNNTVWYTCAASSKNVFVASGPSGTAVFNGSTGQWTHTTRSFIKVAVVKDTVIAGLDQANDGTVWLCNLQVGTINDWFDVTPAAVRDLRIENPGAHKVNVRNLVASKPYSVDAGELIISVGTQDGNGMDTDSFVMYLQTHVATLTEPNAENLIYSWYQDEMHVTGEIRSMGVWSSIGSTSLLSFLVHNSAASNVTGGYDSAKVYMMKVYSYGLNGDHYFCSGTYNWSSTWIRTSWNEMSYPYFTNLEVVPDTNYSSEFTVQFGSMYAIASDEGPAVHMSDMYSVSSWDNANVDPVYEVPSISAIMGGVSIPGLGGAITMWTGYADNKDPLDGEGDPQAFLKTSNGVHYTTYYSVPRIGGVEFMDMYAMGYCFITDDVGTNATAGGLYVETKVGTVQLTSQVDGGSVSILSYKQDGTLTLNVYAQEGRTHIQTPVIYGAAPASASSAGVAGQVAYDANYMYVCTSTNTWKRTPLATW